MAWRCDDGGEVMIGLSDTSPDVERRMYDIYRNMPAWRKIQLVTEAYRGARRLHEAGCRLRQPGATTADVNRAWANVTLGVGPWSEQLRIKSVTPQNEQDAAIKAVIAALDALYIRYAIGGSYASSAHGVPRYTHDADITVEPFPWKERLFALRFPAEEFYVSEEAIREALARRARFNIIHLHSGFKIDIFIRKDRSFDREVLARRMKARVFVGDESEYGLITPEDSILMKLEWFRMGGETSEKQWTDIHGVLMTQGDRLDIAYLDRWAAEIGVKDLLDRARAAC